MTAEGIHIEAAPMRDDLHIYPQKDLKEHILHGGRCWCLPVKDATKAGEVMWVHNAADGREFYEGDS